MADLAVRDQQKRMVEVEVKRLVETLKENLAKHVKDYEEAMAGYKSTLLGKIDSAFIKAKTSLAESHEKWKSKVEKMTNEDISNQSDTISLYGTNYIDMKVPRSYAKDYEAAIDMFSWEVKPTVELTHAEFTCFVRDQWDWQSGFKAISAMYK